MYVYLYIYIYRYICTEGRLTLFLVERSCPAGSCNNASTINNQEEYKMIYKRFCHGLDGIRSLWLVGRRIDLFHYVPVQLAT